MMIKLIYINNIVFKFLKYVTAVLVANQIMINRNILIAWIVTSQLKQRI